MACAPRPPVSALMASGIDSVPSSGMKCSAPQEKTKSFFEAASTPITRCAMAREESWTARWPRPPPAPVHEY